MVAETSIATSYQTKSVEGSSDRGKCVVRPATCFTNLYQSRLVPIVEYGLHLSSIQDKICAPQRVDNKSVLNNILVLMAPRQT